MRQTLYGGLRQHLGEVFRRLAMQKKGRVEEDHLSPTNDDIDPLRGALTKRLRPLPPTPLLRKGRKLVSREYFPFLYGDGRSKPSKIATRHDF